MHLKRVTLEQQEILLSWLEENPEIATGRYRVGHGTNALERQWGVVAGRLNSLGVEKDVKKWQQVWRDWKGNVKKKVQKLNQETDEPNKRGVLTTSEERILALIGEDNSRSQHENFHTSSSTDSTFKGEPVEPEYLEDSEGSSVNEEQLCSWDIPSPAPVAVDRTYPHSGQGPSASEYSPHSRTDDDPLQYKRKSEKPKSFSKKRRRYSEDRYLNLEERRLKLRAQQLDLDSRRLEMERVRVDMSEQLAAVITRLTDIADRLEARLLDK